MKISFGVSVYISPFKPSTILSSKVVKLLSAEPYEYKDQPGPDARLVSEIV